MFKKYGSIENAYNSKYITKFSNRYASLNNEEFIVTEKLDGANIQLFFSPRTKVRVGKRTSFLTEGESFYDVWPVVEKYKTMIDLVQAACDEMNLPIRLYGELFGDGVQKRVKYGPKQFAFFDAEVNGILMAPIDFIAFAKRHEVPMVPIISITKSLAEALAITNEYVTIINAIDNNWSEGTVIRAYNSNLFIQEDMFILKNKGAKFKEKEDNSGKTPKEVNADAARLNLYFREYLNDNRVLSVFSKHGPIESTKQFGDYVRWILDDAIEDFKKDHDISCVPEKEQKGIFNVGSTIALLLKKHV